MSAAAHERLATLPDAACAALVARFREAGFSPKLVADAERFAPGVMLWPRLPALRWWLSQRPDPGARLARLFKYDDPVPVEDAHDALGADLAGALVEAGILALSDDEGDLVARFMITPIAGELWLLSDALSTGREAVMGPGGGTELLAGLVPRAFAGAALDVGCGAGTLALVAARAGARRAVGVDINERAVDVARFNARLNGLRAEFRAGDGVAPVAGEAFDLVLSQPPFVMRPPGAPERTFLFGGLSGDELPRRLLGEIPRVMAPGGRALMLLQSPVRDDAPIATRMRAAVAGAPVDLLTIGSKAPPLAAQASVFASFEDPALGAEYAATVQRYLDHFAASGIREFDGAVVVLGRRPESRPDTPDRPPVRYTIGIRVAHLHYDAASLDGYLRGLDLLALPAEALEQQRLRLSPRASVSSEASAAAGEAGERQVIRIAGPGIGTDWPVDGSQLALIAAIEDAPSLREAIRALADTNGIAPADVRADVLALARDALVRGALLPGD
jgi:SAM-dependent methyltransferase